MTVRRATPEDLDSLAEIEAAAASHPWTRDALASTLATPTCLAWVVERGPVVGHVLATAVADEGEILTLAVHPDARRLGLARTLLQTVEAAWRDAGVTQGWLEVRTDNVGARALYEATGWTNAGVRRAYYDDGTDAVVMHRRV